MNKPAEDHGKFADKIVAKLGGKKDAAEPKDDAEGPTDEASDPPPGKMALAAIKHGDWEALEEAIRRCKSEDYPEG